ncbi:hypothetical protein N900_09115 [Vibrio cholerae O1 str. KW3]|nr:hypothetical protein N900_09115 [Vibrio cholerae O1 str. KW3]
MGCEWQGLIRDLDGNLAEKNINKKAQSLLTGL